MRRNYLIVCFCFHLFVFDFLIKSHKSVTGPVQRPRKRHFTPLGRNLLTAYATSRHSTQPGCQSPSRGAKSGQHNDMLIRWTCRNTHLILDPPTTITIMSLNNSFCYLAHLARFFLTQAIIILSFLHVQENIFWILEG